MRRSFRWALFFIVAVCLVYDAHDRWKGDWWKATINADGYGYYAYLPCIFVLHHFDYAKIISEERKLRPEVGYRDAANCFPNTDNGKPVDKYFVGVAVLLSPFFLLAYLLSYLLGYSLDGYSFLFQISASIAAIFYLVVGLVYIKKLLQEYSIPEHVISLTAVLIVLGTNLLYYATIEPSLSHIYSFGITAFFLYYIKRSLSVTNIKNVSLMTASLCMLIIIRPTGILTVALIPFLAGDFAALKQFFARIFKFKIILLAIVVAFSVLGIQMIVWFKETGHFIYWSYRGERFYFNNPRFFDILFNYRCGWFIYTPLMFLILLTGLIFELKQSLFRFFAFFFFFCALTYLLSSWYSWYFGGFGMRAYVDYYGAFAVFPALVLNKYRTRVVKVSLFILSLALVFLNLTQTRQYTNGIIDKGYMDKERYWKVFLKTDSKYVGIFNPHPPQNLSFYEGYDFENDFECNTWGNDNSITEAYARNARHSAYIGGGVNYSPTFKINASQLPQKNNLYVYITLWVYKKDTNNDAALVVSSGTKGDSIISYNSVPLKNCVYYTNRWQRVEHSLALPSLKNNDDVVKVYAYSKIGATYIDDFKISFASPK